MLFHEYRDSVSARARSLKRQEVTGTVNPLKCYIWSMLQIEIAFLRANIVVRPCNRQYWPI